jgi:hypothetical protein
MGLAALFPDVHSLDQIFVYAEVRKFFRFQRKRTGCDQPVGPGLDVSE